MEILHTFIDLFLHIDHHIAALINNYGTITYIILFAIIFCETGLVILPFLPGDSLLFILGAFAAKGDLNLSLLLVLLSVAAILGNIVNYAVGRVLAQRILNQQAIPFIKKKHLEQTASFYAKHGAKTIIITRFVPIVRTIAPFMAGVGSMPYRTFINYNIIGGLLWVVVGTVSGFLFGNLPWVSKNFSIVVVGIVALSLVPVVLEFLKHNKDS